MKAIKDIRALEWDRSIAPAIGLSVVVGVGLAYGIWETIVKISAMFT